MRRRRQREMRRWSKRNMRQRRRREMRRRRSGNEQAKRKNGHGINDRDTKKFEGREAPQRAKAVGWQAVAVMVVRLDEKKTKKTNKNRRKETKENQKRKKMEVQAKATTNDRNKKKVMKKHKKKKTTLSLYLPRQTSLFPTVPLPSFHSFLLPCTWSGYSPWSCPMSFSARQR